MWFLFIWIAVGTKGEKDDLNLLHFNNVIRVALVWVWPQAVNRLKKQQKQTIWPG